MIAPNLSKRLGKLEAANDSQRPTPILGIELRGRLGVEAVARWRAENPGAPDPGNVVFVSWESPQ